jgi:hypothetical protein
MKHGRHKDLLYRVFCEIAQCENGLYKTSERRLFSQIYRFFEPCRILPTARNLTDQHPASFRPAVTSRLNELVKLCVNRKSKERGMSHVAKPMPPVLLSEHGKPLQEKR